MSVQLAGCAIIDRHGRIGLLHRKTSTFEHWELPGGKVEKQEEEIDAAKREIYEELGVRVNITKQLGATSFSDAHGDFDYTWFLAEVISGMPIVNEPEVFDDFGFFRIEELDRLKLSANMKKFLQKIQSKEVVLK